MVSDTFIFSLKNSIAYRKHDALESIRYHLRNVDLRKVSKITLKGYFSFQTLPGNRRHYKKSPVSISLHGVLLQANITISINQAINMGNWLPSWNGALLEKLTIARHIKNFTVFYGIGTTITVFKTTFHWSHSKPAASVQRYVIFV